jgi:hypothetical protein
MSPSPGIALQDSAASFEESGTTVFRIHLFAFERRGTIGDIPANDGTDAAAKRIDLRSEGGCHGGGRRGLRDTCSALLIGLDSHAIS